MTKRLFRLTFIIVSIGALICAVLLLWLMAATTQLISNYNQATSNLWYDRLISHPQIQTEYCFSEPELLYLGNYRLTYYCACEICCGKTDGITATGTHATADRTIAVDPSVIPYGSQVLINGHTYTAEDCGCAINGNHIDIYVDTHEEALQLGVSNADIYLLTN